MPVEGVFFGYAVDFMDELSQPLNFSLSYNGYHGATRKMLNASMGYDYLLTSKPQRKFYALKISNYFFTDYFTTNDELILTSRFKPYTQFEKLFLPFDEEVWHWLLVTLVVSIVVIVAIKACGVRIQNFVFGRNVTSPIVNFLQVLHVNRC